MLKTILVVIMVAVTAPVAFGQGDNGWLYGTWASRNGYVAVTFKDMQGKVGGRILVHSQRARPAEGKIEKFKLDGNHVTFDAEIDYGAERLVGAPVETNHFDLTVMKHSRMKGTRTFGDGSTRRTLLVKKG